MPTRPSGRAERPERNGGDVVALTVAELVAKLRLDSRDFNAGLSAATGRLDRSAKRMQSVGRTMTRSVTLPLVGVGFAAGKTAIEFEDSFARIEGLVGASTDDLALMREAALDLAGEAGKSPQELGDALFFLQSAGLDAKTSIDALNASAKASAAGLGETAQVADAVSSAVNAYGSEALSAMEATDVLTATVREGKLEASELAPALGRVIPVAQSMGVEFHEVGAAIAGMTRTGLDSAEAVTALRAFMTQIIKPTSQARDRLEALGISVAAVRSTLRDDGLLEAMRLLHAQVGDNADALGDVIPNVRALSGFLNLMGQDAEAVDEIFAGVENSTGATDAAFEAMADTAGFKMKQALADAQVALVEIGDVILPLASTVVGFVSSAARGFAELPGPIKTVAVAIGGVAAVAGPTIFVIGKMVEATSSAVRGFSRMAEAAGNLAARIGTSTAALGGAALAATAAIAGGIIAYQKATEASRQYAKDVEALSDALKEVEGDQSEVNKTVTAFVDTKVADFSEESLDAMAKLGVTVEDMNEAIREGGDVLDPFRRRIEELGISLDGVDVGRLDDIADTAPFDDLEDLGIERDAIQGLIDEIEDYDDVAQDAAKETLLWKLAAEQLSQQQIDDLGIVEALNDENSNFVDVLGRVNTRQAELRASAEGAAASIAAQAGATDEAEDASSGFASGLDTAVEAAENLGEAIDGVNEAYDIYIGRNISSVEATADLHDSFRDLSDTIGENEKTLNLNTEAGAENARAINDSVEAIFAEADARLREGQSIQSVTDDVHGHVAALEDQLVQAGFTREAARLYIEQLNLTPENIETILDTNHEEVLLESELMNGALDHAARARRVTLDIKAKTDALGAFVANNPELFLFSVGHAGGVVPGPPGRERLLLAEGGETIIPRPGSTGRSFGLDPLPPVPSPSSGGTAVIDVDEDRLAAAMMAAMTQATGGGHGDIIVQIDGRNVARAVRRHDRGLS